MARIHNCLEYREQLEALLQSGRSLASLAKEFVLTDQTVRNWVKKAQEGLLGWRELERALLREIARTKKERDILAKVTAWFAKETTRTPRGSSSSLTCIRLNFQSSRCSAYYVSPVVVTMLDVNGYRVIIQQRIKHYWAKSRRFLLLPLECMARLGFLRWYSRKCFGSVVVEWRS